MLGCRARRRRRATSSPSAASRCWPRASSAASGAQFDARAARCGRCSRRPPCAALAARIDRCRRSGAPRPAPGACGSAPRRTGGRSAPTAAGGSCPRRPRSPRSASGSSTRWRRERRLQHLLAVAPARAARCRRARARAGRDRPPARGPAHPLHPEDGRPVQVIEPGASIRLEFLDLSSAADPEARSGASSTSRRRRRSTSSRARCCAPRFCAWASEDHVLQVVVHHIAADGWSKVVFFGELGALYAAYRENRPAALAELPSSTPISPSGSVRGSRASAWSASSSTGAAGWPASLRPLSFPPIARGRTVASLRGGWWRTSIAPETYRRLQELGRSEGATLFMVMLSAFDVLLLPLQRPGRCRRRYSGGHARPSRARTSIGPFVNTIVTRDRPLRQPKLPGAHGPGAAPDTRGHRTPGRALRAACRARSRRVATWDATRSSRS